MSNSMISVFSTIVSSAPVLLVYLLGVVLALVYWGRFPRVCMLMFLGSLILLAVSIAQPMIQMQLMNARNTGSSVSAVGQRLAIMGIAFSIVRAGAFGLIIWAAFAERPNAETAPRGFEPLPPR